MNIIQQKNRLLISIFFLLSPPFYSSILATEAPAAPLATLTPAPVATTISPAITSDVPDLSDISDELNTTDDPHLSDKPTSIPTPTPPPLQPSTPSPVTTIPPIPAPTATPLPTPETPTPLAAPLATPTPAPVATTISPAITSDVPDLSDISDELNTTDDPHLSDEPTSIPTPTPPPLQPSTPSPVTTIPPVPASTATPLPTPETPTPLAAPLATPMPAPVAIKPIQRTTDSLKILTETKALLKAERIAFKQDFASIKAEKNNTSLQSKLNDLNGQVSTITAALKEAQTNKLKNRLEQRLSIKRLLINAINKRISSVDPSTPTSPPSASSSPSNNIEDQKLAETKKKALETILQHHTQTLSVTKEKQARMTPGSPEQIPIVNQIQELNQKIDSLKGQLAAIK
jgi:hypothetical protein